MKMANVSIKLSCQILEISRSGYYAWQKRKPSKRHEENKLLVEEIKEIHQTSRQTYGVPRITAELKNQGKPCSKNRVSRLMSREGLAGVAKRRFQPQTTNSRHTLPIASRVFQTENQHTHPIKPNEVWASDITFIPTDEGWLYLAVFLDIFSRKIVGHAMANHMKTSLVLKALSEALLKQKPQQNEVIIHSDRGCQYAAQDFRDRLKALKILPSMSRKGNCYDNAYVESFFHSLKVEMIHRRKFKTRKEAMTAIFEYIEAWYNPKRLHSSLGYKSPVEYEKINQDA